MTDALLLKVQDAAPLLGCAGKPNEVYRMAAQFPPGVMVRIGRRVRISRPKLEAWLREQGALPETGLAPESPPMPKAISRHVICPTCQTDILWVESKGGKP